MDELPQLNLLQGLAARVALLEQRLFLFSPLLLADIIRVPDINRPNVTTLPEIKYEVTATYKVTDVNAPGGKRDCTVTTSVSTKRTVEQFTDESGRSCIRITYQITISIKDSCKPGVPDITLRHTKTEIKCGATGGSGQPSVAPMTPDDEPATGDTTRLSGERKQTLTYPDGTRVTVTTSADGGTVTIDVQYPDGTTDQAKLP
jgi:hypothetical protein